MIRVPRPALSSLAARRSLGDSWPFGYGEPLSGTPPSEVALAATVTARLYVVRVAVRYVLSCRAAMLPSATIVPLMSAGERVPRGRLMPPTSFMENPRFSRFGIE